MTDERRPSLTPVRGVWRRMVARRRRARASRDPDIAAAVERKRRSEQHLRERGIPVLETLPIPMYESETTRRGTAEVASRALALATVAVKAEVDGEEDGDAVTARLIREFDLDDAFTPRERRFLDDASPTEHARVQFTWRYESYWTLLWALGFVDELTDPPSICDPATAMAFMIDHGRDGFLAAAQLRSQADVLDATDLAYRYHWATRNAELSGSVVAGLDHGVVLERHHALNWLIGWDEDWDEVTTDT